MQYSADGEDTYILAHFLFFYDTISILSMYKEKVLVGAYSEYCV